MFESFKQLFKTLPKLLSLFFYKKYMKTFVGPTNINLKEQYERECRGTQQKKLQSHSNK